MDAKGFRKTKGGQGGDNASKYKKKRATRIRHRKKVRKSWLEGDSWKFRITLKRGSTKMKEQGTIRCGKKGPTEGPEEGQESRDI